MCGSSSLLDQLSDLDGEIDARQYAHDYSYHGIDLADADGGQRPACSRQ